VGTEQPAVGTEQPAVGTEQPAVGTEWPPAWGTASRLEVDGAAGVGVEDPPADQLIGEVRGSLVVDDGQ
jgi:hypothetical protein